jgi:hypothetical protein
MANPQSEDAQVFEQSNCLGMGVEYGAFETTVNLVVFISVHSMWLLEYSQWIA